MAISPEELKLRIELFKVLYNGYDMDTVRRTKNVFEKLQEDWDDD